MQVQQVLADAAAQPVPPPRVLMLRCRSMGKAWSRAIEPDDVRAQVGQQVNMNGRSWRVVASADLGDAGWELEIEPVQRRGLDAHTLRSRKRTRRR